ncbi:Acyl-protein synthetase, LuxE [Belliella baltica DSM 15883]|uniref:Acyl-protein synthetase, LuxE n=1 Tax=Belliella baltica (strain DSM 15883 / CIP 108006 / LMG 21964 / BA134) TaxID=866536 RepID=I3Z9U9_BELBD|nr:acyltransferase [Belliella baltica]AFL86017.1 Acyl-protein synthetase, LuxE [Belliella baltica DSM 15883]
MNYFKSFSEDILYSRIKNFEKMALELFKFQAVENKIYKRYLEARKIDVNQINRIEKIPFLPLRFFKDHQVVTGGSAVFKDYYSSSGTSGAITSKHYIWSKEFYLRHTLNQFEKVYGDISNFHILALLPAYMERPGSSLVSMAEYFIQQSKSIYSGTYLYNHDELIERLQVLKNDDKKVLLLGVTFALLDLAESSFDFPKMDNLIVMETGGMKGRRKEMIREEVHEILKIAFHQKEIHSEYGMTELMSQAYSVGNGKYTLPDTMHVMLRDVNDPYTWAERSQGGINIIDLANFHSCAFLETQDLGRFDKAGELEILGRFDNSDVRGCNLMVI